jgi:hypothetical protein
MVPVAQMAKGPVTVMKEAAQEATVTTGIAGGATVAAASVASLAVEQAVAAAGSARRAAAVGAHALQLSSEPVDRAEGETGGVLHASDRVFRVEAAGDGRGHHHVTSPIVHRDRLAWNRVVEYAVGPGAQDRPENKN